MATMANSPSFDTLHFRLSDSPLNSHVTCSLTIEDPESAHDPSNTEKAYHVSFAVGSDDTSNDEKKAVEWLKANLNNCSIKIDEKQQTFGLESAEKMQTMVKSMAALWVKARVAEQQVLISCPTTASSSATSLYDIPIFSNGGSSTPQILHRPIPARDNFMGGNELGKFYLAMRPSTPGTPMTPVGMDEKEMSKKRALFDEQLIEQLSAIEWREREGSETVELMSPVRPLPLPHAPLRKPSSPSSPNFSRPPTPVVEKAPLVEVQPPNPSDGEKTSKWYHFWHTHSRLSNMKPSIAVLADQSTVILPSPPTDSEKYLYGQTRRLPLYAFGTFSFLSVSVGMWFFVIASKYYMWLGIFVAFIQMYLGVSYAIGYCGKDFDLEGHKKAVQEFAVKDDEECPAVDVYLPCCKEPIEILENTYKYVSKIDYPNYKVWVLDDGGLDTVKRLAAAYGFNYISRDNKPHLKKAGNLRYAFGKTSGDFFLIFDADFCPRADILKEMIPWTRKNEKIAIIQSPQFFRPCVEQTWVEQGASATQEFFYRIVQVNRDRYGAAICVGSNALYRRAALIDVGGTAEIGHSEDVHTGFYAITRGWTLKYMPIALACGISPDTPAACFSQQMRWCAGSSYLLTNPEFWKSDLSFVQKLCFMSGMFFYSSAALMIFVNHVPGPLLVWLSPHLVLWWNCFFAVPSIIYCTVIFRLWSRQNYNFNVNFVYTMQQYAYFMAIKDRVFGTTAAWVPSGDNKAHLKPGEKKRKPNNKYRNMRILCAVWSWGTSGAMFAGIGYRIWQGYHWYHFVPLIVLDSFNIFTAHKFIFYSR